MKLFCSSIFFLLLLFKSFSIYLGFYIFFIMLNMLYEGYFFFIEFGKNSTITYFKFIFEKLNILEI